jgi:hypothetical protein
VLRDDSKTWNAGHDVHRLRTGNDVLVTPPPFRQVAIVGAQVLQIVRAQSRKEVPAVLDRGPRALTVPYCIQTTVEALGSRKIAVLVVT